MSGKFLEKVLDVIGTGIGMPQFVNGECDGETCPQSLW